MKPGKTLRMQKNLTVKQSKIKGAGLGLFAYCSRKNTVFKRGDFICEYTGEELTVQQLEKRYRVGETAKYTVFNPLSCKFIDSANERCLGAYANDTIGTKFKPNAEFAVQHSKFGLVALCTINNGDEIFVNYGNDYWKGLLER